MTPIDELVKLARILGDPANDYCILAEGNVSARHDAESFWVKASGSSMLACDESGFARVRFAPLLEALSKPSGNMEDARAILNGARCDESGALPSTEAFMHGALLEMTDAKFVAHAHPTAVLSVLCLPNARAFAERRLFPDEIVCCGPATCYVPYVAPGIDLARSIVAAVNEFQKQHQCFPRLFWLQNHGVIAIGSTVNEVVSTLAMCDKAAKVLLGALSTSSEVQWLSTDEVKWIANWPDEHFRQAKLRGE